MGPVNEMRCLQNERDEGGSTGGPFMSSALTPRSIHDPKQNKIPLGNLG
jgi:hypothetical protein